MCLKHVKCSHVQSCSDLFGVFGLSDPVSREAEFAARRGQDAPPQEAHGLAQVGVAFSMNCGSGYHGVHVATSALQST
eukprot:3183754-Amphidinium_carterae.1